jgi:hypothetical protein
LTNRLFDWPACFLVFSNRPDPIAASSQLLRRRIQQNSPTALHFRVSEISNHAKQHPQNQTIGFTDSMYRQY